MSRDGYLPPGCTQLECDMAQPGYWDPPQQWFECDACDGSGEIVRGHWGYEPGCTHAHRMEIGEPCGKCNGEGGWIDDAEPDSA
jgi:DnaJ-class molecular chaperone